MKAGKATELCGVTSELLKVEKNESDKRLAEVTDDLPDGKEMPEIWRKSDLIPIYGQKRDVRSCRNYRRLSF